MRQAVGILLILSLWPATLCADQSNLVASVHVQSVAPELDASRSAETDNAPPVQRGELNALATDGDGNSAIFGGEYGNPAGWFAGPCVFVNSWDVTGGRSPTDYAGLWGYGPDWCNTWNARVEWLLWFSRGRNTPPLLTTSPEGTPRAAAGIIGLSTTSIIYGADPIGMNMRNGGRFTLSHLLGDGITSATGRFWGVEDGSETYAINSSDHSILARPFFNVSTAAPDSFLVAFPGVTAPGSAKVLSKNDLFGADAWLSRKLYFDLCCSLEVLAGYQFTRLDDSIAISSTSTSVDPTAVVPVGTRINLLDSFRTQNEFHGGSVGFLADFRKNWLSVELLGKVALGDMRQAVVINGQTTTTSPLGASTTTSRGLFALPSNIGSFERHRFAVSPELNLNGVVHLTPQWRLIAGYSIIYWSNAALAGNQIDTHLNLSQLGGSAANRPAFSFQRADFLVQGINLGADYRW